MANASSAPLEVKQHQLCLVKWYLVMKCRKLPEHAWRIEVMCGTADNHPWNDAEKIMTDYCLTKLIKTIPNLIIIEILVKAVKLPTLWCVINSVLRNKLMIYLLNVCRNLQKIFSVRVVYRVFLYPGVVRLPVTQSLHGHVGVTSRGHAGVSGRSRHGFGHPGPPPGARDPRPTMWRHACMTMWTLGDQQPHNPRI